MTVSGSIRKAARVLYERRGYTVVKVAVSVSSPHRGSPVAKYILDLGPGVTSVISALATYYGNVIYQSGNDGYAGAKQLVYNDADPNDGKVTGMKAFNAAYPVDSRYAARFASLITAQNGRYGPYLKKGNDSRSLESEEQILTLTLDEALAILAQPKRRRGQAAPKPPLKELGPDPDTERPIVVKDGRFGPYVTDGETNASLRKGDSVEELTMDRALELLAERRARGPAP